MACGPHTQAVLDRFVEVANGKAAHVVTPSDRNEISVINLRRRDGGVDAHWRRFAQYAQQDQEPTFGIGGHDNSRLVR